MFIDYLYSNFRLTPFNSFCETEEQTSIDTNKVSCLLYNITKISLKVQEAPTRRNNMILILISAGV